MSWLDRPVTWKWYFGIMAGAYAINYFVLAERRRMEAENRRAQILEAREANQRRGVLEQAQGGGGWKQ